MKVTLFKVSGKTETARRVELGEVARMIAGSFVSEEVHKVRALYHVAHPQRLEDGRVTVNYEGGIRLPRICFAAEYAHRSQERRMLAYTGLVVVELNNLASTAEAIALRDEAKTVPQTLLCFVGASGRSVKIVCRGEWYAAAGPTLPTEPAAIVSFHRRLYMKAHKAYGAQLGLHIETLQPRVDRTVYLSMDPDVWYNADALPFYLTEADVTETVRPAHRPRTDEANGHLLPGRSPHATHYLNYLFILESVLGQWFEVPDEKRQTELVMRIATRSLKEGIPMSLAQAMTLEHPLLSTDPLLVRKTFQTVYTQEKMKEYADKHLFRPLKSIPEDTLLMMKTEAFLSENFEMRKNVMTGVAQYRERYGQNLEFQDLDQEVRNDMTMRAKELGLKSWDKDIDRFIDSTRIEKYDPVNDWLDGLPRWDGEDRIAPLAARVPTSQPHWGRYFRIWMLGMVAHWMGRSTLTGNALVPLLIGRQGCGKTSFCRILLPPELRTYYNDRISFKNETDLNLGLTSFALINIDEFDKTTQRQQVLLKYLLSTADVKFRPPYGKALKQYRRYASFIGTTNEGQPLVDPTGSRRFVCAEILGDIDFSDTLDHRQLYAQLRQMVEDGTRYWLDDGETAALIAENERFRRSSALEDMVAETFCRPVAAEEKRYWTTGEVVDCLKARYRSVDMQNVTRQSIGYVLGLSRFGFQRKRSAGGMVYLLAERKE